MDFLLENEEHLMYLLNDSSRRFSQILVGTTILRLVLLQSLQPKISELTILPRLKPGAAQRVMDSLGKGFGIILIDMIVSNKKVPHERDRTDFVIIEPHKPVKERACLGVNSFRRQDLILWVPAVIQHHGGPILPWIKSLNGSIHLRRLFRSIIVMNAHDGVLVIDQVHQLLNVRRVEEITVDEHRPAFEASEVRSQEPAEGELRALRRAPFAPIQILLPKL